MAGGFITSIYQNEPAPASQVGDITSDAKGSGARYNSGKPPLELIPLTIIADMLGSERGNVTDHGALLALHALGRWQARAEPEEAFLIEALNCLAAGQHIRAWAECADVFDYGRAKYAAWNWAKGMAWSVPLACAARHLISMVLGESADPESGKPHRGHAECNIVMLLTYRTTFPEGDDRPAKGLL